jgi:outer membrane protein insertion porin family
VKNTQLSLTITSIFFLLLTTFGCNSRRYLIDNQSFLDKNNIVLHTDNTIRDRTKLAYELSTVLKQEPNTRFLFNSRRWFFYAIKKDTKSRIAKVIREKIGEPPAIYNQKIAQQNTESMRYFLQNKGYFNAKVTLNDTSESKKGLTTARYDVFPGKRYTVSNTLFQSTDPDILKILKETESQSFLQAGAPVSVQQFEAERARFTHVMRDSGYAFFNPKYINSLEGDSINTQVGIELNILNPTNNSFHTKYKIGNVTVFPAHNFSENTDNQLIENNITFKYFGEKIPVNTAILQHGIYFKPGDTYRETAFDRTYRSLSKWEMYRSVSLKTEINKEDPLKLDVSVLLSPAKRMSLGFDVGANFTSTTASVQGNRIGMSGAANWRNRNLLGGAEQFNFKLEGGLQFGSSRTSKNFIASQEIKAQAELFKPIFLDFFGIWKWVGNLQIANRNVIRPQFYKDIRDFATSRFSVTYNYIALIDFYRINSFKAKFGYEYQQSSPEIVRYSYNQTSIDFQNPIAYPYFRDTILAKNPFLQRSFGPRLFTSFIFSDFNYSKTTPSNNFGEVWTWNANAEISGFEVGLVNTAYNALSTKNDTFRLRKTEFAQYARTEAEARYVHKFTARQAVAGRFLLGIAAPFGYSTNVPYIKQFFMGGPNSLRGWRLRELGPGGYKDPKASELSYNRPYYQAGDFRMEFNGEYRFKVYKYFESAIFLDGGNVWLLKQDKERPLANLSSQFFNQIALDSGVGIRGDFKFFILRLDLGIKLRNPYPDDNNRYWKSYRLNQFAWRDVNPNLALGYAF